MIITKTPFRMSFFGGGTDIEEYFNDNDGMVLSTTFDKYCYVTARHLPRFFEYRNQLTYSKIERVKNADEFQHPMVKAAIQYMNIEELVIAYDADLPARSGLGTSSSFAVGLCNALHALKGEYASKKELADDAIYIERKLCKEAGGWQDQIAAAFGGLNIIKFSKTGYSVEPIIISSSRKQTLNDNLMLFFTGFSRLSSDIQAETKQNYNSKKKMLDEMKNLVLDAEKILVSEKNDIDEFGRMLNYAWELKRQIGKKISTEVIDELYAKALEAGAIGGKLLGAGGGGFLLFYVPHENQAKVKEQMNGLLHVPFRFENDGTSVVYYSPED